MPQILPIIAGVLSFADFILISFVFLYFLDKNGILYHKDGSKRIADHTLVALTIMIAESRTEEKEMMVSIIMNCI